MEQEALLSSNGEYTIFRYGGHVIRFLAPYSLERYTQVLDWDAGCLTLRTSCYAPTRGEGLRPEPRPPFAKTWKASAKLAFCVFRAGGWPSRQGPPGPVADASAAGGRQARSGGSARRQPRLHAEDRQASITEQTAGFSEGAPVLPVIYLLLH